ncbi:hypothetical protein [Arthrobacter mobilis]|uniref:Uncharacterized protein n=1 Tax=Arthrobacter mobilis TaxID=2724944 RepID=A0A7X6HCE0_9MICC|nr:hypothetical protein [Arthrobacter mobilis]NKX54406.1 hypothetical protein [Arthrobacter mobilis]
MTFRAGVIRIRGDARCECITVVPAGILGTAPAPSASGLLVTPLDGLLPEINIAVGISDAGLSKNLADDFPKNITRFLRGESAAGTEA